MVPVVQVPPPFVVAMATGVTDLVPTATQSDVVLQATS
jgi:hypothetical protein